MISPEKQLEFKLVRTCFMCLEIVEKTMIGRGETGPNNDRIGKMKK